ncbi:MAG: ribosome maturation factor RimM [Pseudomonadota bacterium]
MAGPVVVGKFGGTYGIKGWLHVRSFTEPPANLLAYRPWLVRQGSAGAWQEVAVEQCKPHKQGFVVKLTGLDSPEQAQTWVGAMVAIPAAVLPAPEDPEEYYWRDLLGCEVFTLSGQSIGKVQQILETGAHEVLCVRPQPVTSPGATGDQAAEDVLIPFVPQYVHEVDIVQRRMTVDWQADW